MSWLTLSLTASFLWALVNISDKYIVSKYSTNAHTSGALVLFSSLIGIFVAGAISLFTDGIFDVPFFDKILLIITGAITALWVIMYCLSLEIEDVSSVVPVFLTVPIFSYILGYIFLGEKFSNNQLLGAFIILFGVSIISIDFSNRKKKIKWRATIYILVASLLIAISGVLFKYVTIGNNFWAASFWGYIGLGIAGILIYFIVPEYRKQFIILNKKGGFNIFALNTISEILTTIGNLLVNYSLLLAPVAMIYLVNSFQPVLLIFLTICISKIAPNIINENLKLVVLLPKIMATIIMAFGSALLFY